MIQRINGSLAVSRALGDYEYKNVQGRGQCEQLVSPEPEIFVRDRSDQDEFLVLACDGVWDVMSNEDICNFIRSRLLITDDLEAITNQVVDTCLYKVRNRAERRRLALLSGLTWTLCFCDEQDSRDNMSIVLVTFPGAPTPCPEAILKEKQLEEVLEKRVKGD